MNKETKINIKIDVIEPIFGLIDKLPRDNIEDVLDYCKKRQIIFKMEALGTEISKSIKNEYDNYYPQLIKFADGIKVTKYDKKTIDKLTYCEFEIEYCNFRSKCSEDKCPHLKIKCDGDYKKNDFFKINHMLYCIEYDRSTARGTSSNKESKYKELGYFCIRFRCNCTGEHDEVFDDGLFFRLDALDDIMNVFLFDREKFKMSQKTMFGGICSRLPINILHYFFRDCIRVITNSFQDWT